MSQETKAVLVGLGLAFAFGLVFGMVMAISMGVFV